MKRSNAVPKKIVKELDKIIFELKNDGDTWTDAQVNLHDTNSIYPFFVACGIVAKYGQPSPEKVKVIADKLMAGDWSEIVAPHTQICKLVNKISPAKVIKAQELAETEYLIIQKRLCEAEDTREDSERAWALVHTECAARRNDLDSMLFAMEYVAPSFVTSIHTRIEWFDNFIARTKPVYTEISVEDEETIEELNSLYKEMLFDHSSPWCLFRRDVLELEQSGVFEKMMERFPR